MLRKTRTLRAYSLRIELLAFVIISALLFVIVGFAQQELRQKFIDSALSDAAQFELFIDRQLQLAHDELSAFATSFPDPPMTAWTQSVHFSDLYRLDDRFEIREIIQSEAGNDLFPGFVFGSGVMTEFLQRSQREGRASSGLIRGYERETPSLYLATTIGSEIFLGHINLNYYSGLLEQYAAMANQEMLVVTPAGLVMMRSSESPTLPQVREDTASDVSEAKPQLLIFNEQNWFFTRSSLSSLNAELIMLVPDKLYSQIQILLWSVAASLLILLLGLMTYKQLRIHALVLNPLHALSRRFQKVSSGEYFIPSTHSTEHVQELDTLSQQFGDMATKVQERETALALEKEKLLKAKQYAERLEQAKSEFLANMSHEIRTPLTVILGMNHLLASDASPEQLKKIEQIESSGQSLLTLINDILDLEKIEAGKLEIRVQPFVLTDLAHQTVEKHRLLLNESIQLHLDLENAPPTELLGDSLRIEQVVNNLLSNAIKFTAEGKIEVTVTTLVQTPESLRVRFSVRDSGIGIAATQIHELFDPFMQADNSLTRNFPGTGLGLPISKHLVELMGGTIGVQSTLGKGSTFWFELPLRIATDALAQNTAQKTADQHAANETFDLTGLHVLVVDDSATIRLMVEEMLQSIGVRVSLAKNGSEALRFLEQHPVDLVLMDVQMPIMDGLTCAQQIRQQLKLTQLPIVALTAGLFSNQQQEIYQAGMNDVLSKPIVFKQMLSTLAYWSDRLETRSDPTLDRNQAHRFPEIAGIDRASAEAMTEANLPLYLHLLELFRDEYRHAADELEAAMQQNQYVEAGKLLHKIRGSASQLGALELAATAAVFEQQLKEKQHASFAALHARFRAQLAVLDGDSQHAMPSLHAS